MARVLIRNLNKMYDDSHAVKDVNLHIRDKEFLVLVGPSGCGKTTTLRMVAGLETITSGQVLIGDTVVNDLAPMDRDIAMVFQNYALYPHMSVYDNMAFGLKMRKVERSEIRKRVQDAADILGIRDYLARKPRQLSGGQRQRVALGRAIVRHPQVILFDEPLSNLDAKLRVALRTEIKELHQRLKTTTVYVTHDQVEAMTMADKIVVMHDGVVEQVGAPLELYNNPVNMFVAGFIGSPAMNFLKGRCERGRFLLEDGSVLPLPARLEHLSCDAVYGVRPEHLVRSDDGLALTVAVVEPTGAETQVIARHGSQSIVCIFRDSVLPQTGETIRVTPDVSRVHAFSERDGRRLL